MALFVEYFPFMGMRSWVVDTKESIHRVFDAHPKMSFAAKTTTAITLLALPWYGLIRYGSDVADVLSELTEYMVSDNAFRRVMARGTIFYTAGVLGGLVSTKRKGAFHQKFGDREPHTSEYKFPYVYSPFKSLSRAIKYVRYVNRIWKVIPTHRKIKTHSDALRIMNEIDNKAKEIWKPKYYAKYGDFTKKLLEEVMDPIDNKKVAFSSEFPFPLPIRDHFLCALYMNARDMFPEDEEKRNKKIAKIEAKKERNRAKKFLKGQLPNNQELFLLTDHSESTRPKRRRLRNECNLAEELKNNYDLTTDQKIEAILLEGRETEEKELKALESEQERQNDPLICS